jgi:exoribonuclease R
VPTRAARQYDGLRPRRPDRRNTGRKRCLEEARERNEAWRKQEEERRRIEAQREFTAPWRVRWLNQVWEEDGNGDVCATVDGFCIRAWDDGICRWAQVYHDKYVFDSVTGKTIEAAKLAAIDGLLDSPEFAKECLSKVLQ